MEKLSVFAPVALAEQFENGTGNWRNRVNAHAPLRLRLMWKSFAASFDRSSVERFLIVCPARDQDALHDLVSAAAPNLPIEFLDENRFLVACGLGRIPQAGLGGWQMQQILKLAFARICETPFYLTLDSDIVQFRRAGLADLLPARDKSLIGVESTADYDRLYTPRFAAKEKDAKRRYYEAAQHILAYDRPADRAGVFFSETPVVLSRSGAMEMIRHVESIHRRGIVEVLTEFPGWTEYPLYFQFLEMAGLLSELHIPGGCNAVLSLEKSVWQPSDCYRSQRFYDRQHFVSSPLVREGPFLAIQSWIRTEEWLPARYCGLDDFYRQLETWIEPTPSAPPAPSGSSRADLDPASPGAFLQILRSVDPSSALFRRARQVLDATLESGPTIPPATPPGEPKFLTIGMTTHRDYDGCYFTIQAIRLYHPEILNDVELLVIDNDPTGPCAGPLKALEAFIPNFRYIPFRSRQGTAVRDLVFREASGEFVLCIDCHIFFPPGALAQFIAYCRSHPQSRDLLQGPLLSDAFEPLATHFEPRWSHGMYGTWGMDDRGASASAEPFEIGMQGMGVFACRREAWPGFNPRLSGFGGEEGYLHEKIRRAGGRNLCLPFFRWLHRFERPLGVPYQPVWADRVRNYLIVHHELGLDPTPCIQHFEELLGQSVADPLVFAARDELASPFHYFDAIYCINLDKDTVRWEAMKRRFRRLGIESAVRRFPAAETPLNHHIGCALSHRRIIADARQQGLETVLVFEDDAQFSPDAASVLTRTLAELSQRDWQLVYLGGYRSESALQDVPGCHSLKVPGWITCTHAIAYHRSVYHRILEAVPDNAVDVALWLRDNLAIDKFYNSTLGALSFLTWPVIVTQSSILSAELRPFED